jgi:hypothetical protein
MEGVFVQLVQPQENPAALEGEAHPELYQFGVAGRQQFGQVDVFLPQSRQHALAFGAVENLADVAGEARSEGDK